MSGQPVGSRDLVAEVLYSRDQSRALVPRTWGKASPLAKHKYLGYADALIAAGVFRDEAAEADGEWDPVNNTWKVPPTTRNYPGAESPEVSDEALLNQFIDNGKRIVREEQGDDHTPTTAEVERFIPPDLRRKFWERYTDKYFDQVTP